MRHLILGGSFVLAIGASSQVARAQAWTDAKGDLSLTLGSSFQFADAVYFGDAVGRISGLGTEAARSTFRVGYTPIEKLTINAEMGASVNHYSGAQMGANPTIVVAHGSQDDGEWHPTLDDATFEVRYQLLDQSLALTPILRGKVPMTDYETMGHAATGTGLMEAGLGAYIGKIGIGSDRVLAQAGYVFNLVEKFDGAGAESEEFSMHFSKVQVQGGYIFDRFVAIAGIDLQYAHGGLELDELRSQSAAVQAVHDPLLARRYLALVGAVNYTMSESLSLGGYLGAIVWGDNVSDAKTVGLQLTWSTNLYDDSDETAFEDEEWFEEEGFDEAGFDEEELDEGGLDEGGLEDESAGHDTADDEAGSSAP